MHLNWTLDEADLILLDKLFSLSHNADLTVDQMDRACKLHAVILALKDAQFL